ncbi:MAG: TolC family protein [Polyangiaceae bacterium]
MGRAITRLLPTWLWAALLASSTSALAQPKAPEPKDPQPKAPVDDRAEKPEATPAPAETASARLPEVDDPMLAPVPAAKHTVKSWQQALKLVRTRSTSLRQARAQVESASARSRQALAGAYPRIIANASVQRHLLRGNGTTFRNGALVQDAPIPDPATTWQAGVTVTQPLLALAAWHDHGTTKRSIRAAKLSAKEVERQVLAGVAESIVNVITAERLAEIRRVSLRSALSTLSLNRRRFRLGSASAVDVLRAEQEVNLLRAQIVSADEGVRRSREALGLALGDSEAWSVNPRIKLDALARDTKGSCRAEPNVESRPDVRAARAQLEVAERGVTSAQLGFAPTIDAISSLTYFEPESQINQEHVTWTIGAVLTWTIYDGGRRGGGEDVSRADMKLAEAKLDDAKRRARLEVTQARRSVEVALATLKVTGKTRDLARETARLSRLAFVNGSGTSFELVDSDRRLQEAEIDVAIKEFELVRARITAMLSLATCDV